MTTADICRKAKEAASLFLAADRELKNRILSDISDRILKNTDRIIAENAKDLEKAKELDRGAAFIDRLSLNKSRIKGIVNGVDEVRYLDDPVGEVTEIYTLKSGLTVKKVRSPLGVIGIIFEARPNVAVDAAVLCIKSGNGVVLRGSREAVNSVNCFAEIIKEALEANGVCGDLCGVVSSNDRAETLEMLKQEKYIDIIIPRGGESLKKVVLENAAMPVLASAGGNCHLYVAKSADAGMAERVVINAKVSRPGVCNALETLLVDRERAEVIPVILRALQQKGVELRGTEEVSNIFPVKIIDDAEFYTEYEDLIIKVKLVDGVREAVAHINKYGTNHSEAIITEDNKEAEYFTKNVDSAAVYVNASTRFTDGFELGLGAEMGISTGKLHVRGPIGLKELTSVKYTVFGDGQIR